MCVCVCVSARGARSRDVCYSYWEIFIIINIITTCNNIIAYLLACCLLDCNCITEVGRTGAKGLQSKGYNYV